ncbi:MAG: TetR/AcrR family transcriptional regulator [Acidimicrobiales bacterium]
MTATNQATVRKPNKRGTKTRDRMIDAALESLAVDGYRGSTARAIATRGELSQASIFYHYNSVEELLLDAIRQSSARRLDRYRKRIDPLNTIGEVLSAWQELHLEDIEVGHAAALNALVTAGAHDSLVGVALLEVLSGWRDYVTSTVERVTAGLALGKLVDPELASTTIVALFMGVELLSRLEDTDYATPLFGQADRLATLLQLGSAMPPTKTSGRTGESGETH